MSLPDVLQATSFTATVISYKSIRLSWVRALYNLAEYEVTFTHSNTLMTSGALDVNQTNYTFANLEDANTTYEFSLLTYNDYTSNSSALTVNATTEPGIYDIDFLDSNFTTSFSRTWCGNIKAFDKNRNHCTDF